MRESDGVTRRNKRGGLLGACSKKAHHLSHQIQTSRAEAIVEEIQELCELLRVPVQIQETIHEAVETITTL